VALGAGEALEEFEALARRQRLGRRFTGPARARARGRRRGMRLRR
jgi:hypothetical protein